MTLSVVGESDLGNSRPIDRGYMEKKNKDVNHSIANSADFSRETSEGFRGILDQVKKGVQECEDAVANSEDIVTESMKIREESRKTRELAREIRESLYDVSARAKALRLSSEKLLGNGDPGFEKSIRLEIDPEHEPIPSKEDIEKKNARLFAEAAIEIAKQKAELAMQEAERVRTTDPLTGLLNQIGFEIHSQEVFQNSRRGDVCIFGIMDVRDFKSINDKLGHHVGDKVLLAVARIMKDNLRLTRREKVVLARFGQRADEFGFLIHHISEESQHGMNDAWMLDLKKGALESIAARFREGIDQEDWSSIGLSWPLKINIGVVGIVFTGRPVRETFFNWIREKADRKMFAEKEKMKISGGAITKVYWNRM